LLVAGISTAIVVAGVVLPKLGQHQQINEELSHTSLQAAQLASQYVAARLDEAERQVNSLAAHEHLSYRHHAAAGRLLSSVSRQGTGNPELVALDAAGKPVAASGPLPKADFRSLALVADARRQDKPVVSTRLAWPGSDRATVAVAKRFKYYDREGEHWGVVLYACDLATWNTVLNQRFKRVELFDREGAALLPESGGAEGGVGDRPEVREALLGQSGTRAQGHQAVVAYAGIPRLQGAVVTSAPTAEKLLPVSRDIERAGRYGLIALLIAGVLSFFMSGFITAPIRRLESSAAAVARGDWAGGEIAMPLDRQDELGRLALSFNTMAQQLRERFAGIEAVVAERTAEVAQRTKELEKTNNQLLFAYEELKELEQLKASFLDAVSHELRTPLNFIMGFGSSLEDEVLGPLNDDQTEAIRKIMEGADRLLLIINDLIDISQLEAGQLQLAPQPIELNEVFQVAVAQFGQLFKERQHEAVVDIEDELPPAYADPERVGQILRQVLSNAHKFTEPGGTITLKAFRQGQKVVVEVQDTGIGIPADVMPYIWESFRQGDGSRTRKHGGTGVGLTIVKRLAEAMGETVEVKSVVGRGTAFRFTLPVVLFDEQGQMMEMAATVVARPARRATGPLTGA
jgi:signal transduction histidine kinase